MYSDNTDSLNDYLATLTNKEVVEFAEDYYLDEHRDLYNERADICDF